jgi:hypothetical protein
MILEHGMAEILSSLMTPTRSHAARLAEQRVPVAGRSGKRCHVIPLAGGRGCVQDTHDLSDPRAGKGAVIRKNNYAGGSRVLNGTQAPTLNGEDLNHSNQPAPDTRGPRPEMSTARQSGRTAKTPGGWIGGATTTCDASLPSSISAYPVWATAVARRGKVTP